MSESKIESVVQVAYGIPTVVQLRRDVKIYLQKTKTYKIRKMLSKEEKVLINISRQENRYGMKNCLQHSPMAIHNKTVKRLQWKIDDTGTVNRKVNLAVKENEELFKQKCRIISAIYCRFYV